MLAPAVCKTHSSFPLPAHLILYILAGWHAGVIEHDHEGAAVAVAVGQLVHEAEGLQVELLHAAALIVPQVTCACAAAECAGPWLCARGVAAPVAAFVLQWARMCMRPTVDTACWVSSGR